MNFERFLEFLLIRDTVRPAKAGLFSGRQSHRGKSQNPVARVPFVEETKRMKRTDKAIFRMVSKFSGRNVSELRGSLVRIQVPEAEPVVWGRRPHDVSQTD